MSNPSDSGSINTQQQSMVQKTVDALIRKRKKKPAEDAQFVDMVAFASLMTILLAFFIMLSSYAGPPKEKDAEEVIDSFKEALENYGVSQYIFGKSDSIANLKIKQENYGGRSENNDQIVKNVFANTIDKGIDIEYKQAGHKLVFPTEIHFIDNTLEISPESMMYLNNLINVIKNRDCHIIVEGYTSENFVPTEEYPTSWQLSAEYASAIAKYFNDAGKIDYKRLTAVGYGKYQPLLDQTSSGYTQANNRINIIVSDE